MDYMYLYSTKNSCAKLEPDPKLRRQLQLHSIVALLVLKGNISITELVWNTSSKNEFKATLRDVNISNHNHAPERDSTSHGLSDVTFT